MSSRLINTGNRFKTRLKKVNGAEFFGQLLDIPDTSRVSNFLSARRYLRVHPLSKIKPGDVIIANNIKYIVANHADGFHLGVIYKHFKLFEVDKEFQWFKKSFSKNPVTGIEETVLTEQYETVYLSIQPSRNLSDSLSIPQETFTVISNIEIKRDEIIDKYVVIKVNEMLGVFVLDMKEI